MVFFGEILVFPQPRWIGLFGAKTPCLYLETHKLQRVFLSKTNSILKGKQCATCLASNTDGFLPKDTCVSSTQLDRHTGNNMTLLHLQNNDLHEVLIQTHSTDKEECDRWSWFYTHSFQSRGKSVFQLFWIDLFGKKWAFPHFERFNFQELFHWKNYLKSQIEKMC
jgi:hypothetical protein